MSVIINCAKCSGPILPGENQHCPACVDKLIVLAERTLTQCFTLVQENKRLQKENLKLRQLLAVEMEGKIYGR